MDDFAKFIITILAAAVAAMWGFVVVMWRTQQARSDKRIDTLESREDKTNTGVVAALNSVRETMTTQVDAFRELRLAFEKMRDDMRQGGNR